MTTLIGFTGNAGVGKTSAQLYMEIKYDYKSYNMADPLKKIGEIVGFEQDELYGTQKQKLKKNKHWNVSARKFLQIFGTEICKTQLEKALPEMKNIWIRCFEKYYKKNKCDIAVGDIRFADEAETIKKLGGFVVKISREVDTSPEFMKHSSESKQHNIIPDYHIVNNGTMHEFQNNIDNILKKINIRKKITSQ